MSEPFSLNVDKSLDLEFSSSDTPSTAVLEVEPCDEVASGKGLYPSRARSSGGSF